VPAYSDGDGTPTFTRATTATVTDFEGLLKTAKSGESRFEGARRVENLITTPDITNVAWVRGTVATGVIPEVTNNYATSPDGSLTATRIQFNSSVASGDWSYILYSSSSTSANSKAVASVWLKTADGTTKTLWLEAATNLFTLITVTSNWKRFSVTSTVGGTPTLKRFALKTVNPSSSLTADILLWHPQLEDVTGQANQNPSEYVSNGVLSAPYHGANVDGVKYFPYQNSNTVVDNVVTEAQGPAIPEATLKGYLAEGAMTNLLLQSAVPVTQNVTVTAVPHTISMWGTGTCTLSGVATGVLTGTGANDRVQLSFTPTAGALTLTFAGTNTNGQLEIGVFASSIITTTTATVTRNSDVESYATANNLLSTGALTFSFTPKTTPFASAYLFGTYIDASNSFAVLHDGTNLIARNIVAGTNYDATIPLSYVANTTYKVAIKYGNRGLAIAVNGVLGTVNASVLEAQLGATYQIGANGNGGGHLFGTIKNVKIWKTALKDSKLMSLTR
jgi:hypothetical protein